MLPRVRNAMGKDIPQKLLFSHSTALPFGPEAEGQVWGALSLSKFGSSGLEGWKAGGGCKPPTGERHTQLHCSVLLWKDRGGES